jgi:hypothetical protein
MLFKLLFDHHHHPKTNNLLQNQVNFSFILLWRNFNSFLSLEISTCCSVTKPKDYEYIPYQPKESSTKNDYVSFSSIFFYLIQLNSIIGWSKWVPFMVFISFNRFRHLNSNKYFIHYFNKSQLSSTPINKNTFRWFMFTFNIIWSQLHSIWSNEHIKFRCNRMVFNSNVVWMLSLSTSSLCQ